MLGENWELKEDAEKPRNSKKMQKNQGT